MTKAEYAREYRQARRETARLVIAGKKEIRKAYIKVFSQIARVIRENKHKPFLEEQIRSAFPKRELYEYLKRFIMEGRGKAVKLTADVNKRYILEALQKVPGHGLSVEKIGRLFDQIAEKHRQGSEPAVDPSLSPPAVQPLSANSQRNQKRPAKPCTCGHAHFTVLKVHGKTYYTVKNALRKTYQGQSSGEPHTFTFGQSHSLSKSLWAAVGDAEEKIMDVVWGGISQGRDVRSVSTDLMAYLKGGPEAVKGRWGKLEPGTREYAKRLGSKGVDYRAMRLYRSEIHRHQQEAAVEEGEDNPACTGLYDWILMPGRGTFSCACPEIAAEGPYTKDTIPAYPHPNCDCMVEPRLKDSDDLIRDLKDYVNGVPSEGANEISLWAQRYELGEDLTGKSVGADWDQKLQEAVDYGVHNEKEARRLGKYAFAKAQREDRDITDILAEYRDFNTDQNHVIQAESNPLAAQWAKVAQRCFPTDWLNKSVRLSEGKPMLLKKSGENYYNRTKKILSSSTIGSRTTHEWAHRMQEAVPRIRDIEEEFYKRRTKDEGLVKINTFEKYKKAKDDVLVKIDRFRDPQMGRDYQTGKRYEVFSMGIEDIWYKTYNADREYREFIVGILLGV
jgi:hypothetical protein